MSNYASLSDNELAALLREGDRSAFGEIFNRYWDILFLHAARMTGNEDDAKDIVQEMFSTLWLKHAEIHFSTTLSGYLYITIRNRILNLIRKYKIRHDFTELLALYMRQQEDCTIAAISFKELESALENEIQQLPAKMRQVFELSRNQSLSHKEIAEELNISVTTVKKQINNALKIIRPKLTNLAVLLLIDLFK